MTGEVSLKELHTRGLIQSRFGLWGFEYFLKWSGSGVELGNLYLGDQQRQREKEWREEINRRIMARRNGGGRG